MKIDELLKQNERWCRKIEEGINSKHERKGPVPDILLSIQVFKPSFIERISISK